MSVPAQSGGLGLCFFRICTSTGLGGIQLAQSAVCMALDGFAYHGSGSIPKMLSRPWHKCCMLRQQFNHSLCLSCEPWPDQS